MLDLYNIPWYIGIRKGGDNVYFEKIASLEELKKAYKKLALKMHPDRGGDEKAFISMKEEYDQLFDQLKKGGSKETSKAFQNVIDALLNLNLTIEIVGTWVWVSGNTYAAKEELKKAGFKYAKNKKAWYWYEGEYVKKSRKKYTMSEIKDMHGYQTLKTAEESKSISA
jgi:curved DNA-binding protein CbpA